MGRGGCLVSIFTSLSAQARRKQWKRSDPVLISVLERPNQNKIAIGSLLVLAAMKEGVDNSYLSPPLASYKKPGRRSVQRMN